MPVLARLTVIAALLLPAAGLAARAKPKPRVEEPALAPADAAFGQAKKAYESLKKDEKRRKFRDQWTAVIEKFESVAEKYPKSPRAAEALLTAADLYAELSRVSLAKKDLKAAIEAYRRLCERFPKSNLADDAHMALGRIYLDRKDDAAMAQVEFKAAAACRGDQVQKAKAALAALPPVPPPSLEKPKPREVPKEAAKEPAPPTVVAAKESKPEEPAADEVKPTAASATGPGDEEDDDEDAHEESISLKDKLNPAHLKALQKVERTGDVPLSVQVGLKVKRVIIDAGHGGHDTGAIGPTGVKEKDATLAIAKKLEAKLKTQGFDVLMTRDSDTFVALEDRARFANKHRGDLFVSIHCNAVKERSMRGIETWTLNVSSDRYAMRLAARENAASEKSLSDLQMILADLATRANTDDSTRLAKAVQSSLVSSKATDKRRPKDLGVKQALFYVLLGARMPAVLVETAFISNPEDEKHLADADYQAGVADDISEGISRFIAEREQLANALTE